VRHRIDTRVTRPAVGDCLAVALHGVLVAEARTPNVDAPRMDPQNFVEVRGPQEAGVGLDRHCLHSLLSKRRVTTAETRQVIDPRHFEPHQVLGVVRDPLRVGFGEADLDLRVEAEAVDAETLEA
jgi:hypothetical protein